MSETTTPEFGKWRARFWPVHAFELKKLLPMVAMTFLILFNYTILRDAKDTVLVNLCGAEAIPFVKVWGTVPFAILFLIIYSKMSNSLSRTKLFYASLTPFIVFFGLFATVIYPNFEAFQPNGLADGLQSFLPANLHVVGEIIRCWPAAIFYIFAELWGSVVLSLLFWGFANQICSIGEAKRVYPLFGLFGNFGLMLSGPVIIFFANIAKRTALTETVADHQAFGMTLSWITAFVIVGALVVMGLYWWMHKYVLNDPRFIPAEDQKRKKKKKPKMNLMESFKYLAKSKYLLRLSVLVLAYGIAINLIEVTWKHQLKLQYPNKTDYMAFMGYFSMVTGIFSVFMMLFVGGNVMRRFGWTTGALFTPIMIAATGACFFAFIIFRDSLGGLIALAGTTPLFMAVVVGAVQNILSKGSKYSLFDPTKEMAYIPLDEEQKVKGKAAIDVAAARFGKSGGSLIQQFLIGTIGISAMTPIVAILVGGVVFLWIGSAKSLGRMFNALNAKKEAEAAEEEKAEAAPATAASAG